MTKASTGRVQFDIPRASGGKAPLSYDIKTTTGADLNTINGITFVEAGTRKYLLIDRNDVAAGTTNLRITVTDNRGVQATQDISVTAYSRITLAKPPNIAIGPGTPTTPHILPAATGGSGSYRYTLTGFPTGAGFSAASRTLTVSNRISQGTYNLTYTAVDTADATNTASQTFTVTRSDVVLTFSTSIADRTVYPEADGATPAVSLVLPTATGGTGPYTYALEDDAGAAFDARESAGVTFNPATRTMTYDADTLDNGANSFVYRATDSLGNQGTLNFTITATERLQLDDPADITISDDTVQTTTRLPVARGGSGNYSYSITGAPANFTVATAPPTVQYDNTVARGTYHPYLHCYGYNQ